MRGNVPKKTETPTESRVDKACSLILQLFDTNNISKSEGLSAMATLISSILATQKDPKHFYAVLKMMQISFENARMLTQAEEIK